MKIKSVLVTQPKPESEKSPYLELSKKFKRQVEFVMEKICNFPLANAVRYNNVRIANLAIFPYAIHYIIDNEMIIVLAIYDTAINPNKWLTRLEL